MIQFDLYQIYYLEVNLIHSLYLGSSIAISWAWGTSLILGMQIAQTKGLEAFSIWAIANCLTLVLFGFLYRKNVLKPEVLQLTPVRIFTNLIQIFCLIIQLKILNETLLNFFSPLFSYLITAGGGIGLTILMYYRGLKESIRTDLFQSILTIGTLLVMVYLCLDMDPKPTITSNSSDIGWGIWSACILLSGIMTDIQHWQRAKVNKGYAFECAGVFFALYLALVFILSKYQFTSLLNTLLLIVVIGVTTSTIDSIAVALHKDFGKKNGTLLALCICMGYGLLLELSVLSIWSYFGVIRVGLALFILYWCIFKYDSVSRRHNNNLQ